jgi:hypothetical protein
MTEEPQLKTRRYVSLWPGCNIRHLILADDDFIVFLDPDLDVDWSTSVKYEETDTEDHIKERNDILNREAIAECVPNDHQRENVRLNFKRMVGEAVARALERDYDSAKRMLEQARSYIEARNVERARYWQLCTACTLGLLCGLFGLTMWWFREYFIRVWREEVYFLVMAGVAGSVGAVLSMIFRMGRTFPTSEAPRALHTLEAASRVLAGCFSGLLAAGSVQIGLILSVTAGAGQKYQTMLVVAMASGASERLAPSIIARLENSSGERQPRKGKSRDG